MFVKQEDRFGMRGYSSPSSRWVPSVSEILDILCPVGRNWIDEEALRIGQALHHALFLASKNSLTKTGMPRADAALDWLASEGLTVVEAETDRINRKVGYGGRPDALLRTTRGRYIVADFKFAESVITRHKVQLELYRRLYAPEIRYPDMVLIQIPKDGRPKPKQLIPNPSHYAGAINALQVITWRLTHGK